MRRRRFSLGGLSQIRPGHVARRAIASMKEGWYFGKEDEASRDRARLVIHNYNANIVANLIGGTFYTGLLLLISADDGFIGMMTMISTAANMLQMFAPLLLERFQKRKTILLVLYAVMMALNIVFLGLIPIFPLERQGKLALVAATVLVVNVINAFISPGLSIWHMQSIRPNVRNAYFTLITMTVGAVVAIVNLLGSSVVDAFRAWGMEYQGLMALRLLCVAIMIFNIARIAKIKEYPYHTSGKRFTAADLLVKPFREKLYLRTVAVTFLWNITANIPGTYFTVYLLGNLGVSYTYIMLVNFINVPIVMFATPLWNRLMYRKTKFTVLYLSMSLYMLHYVVLAFVAAQTMWLYVVGMIIAFILAAGINLSFTGIPYVNMPEENQTLFLGFYSTIANLAAFLGVSIGRQFILMTENANITLLGVAMGNKQLILLLTAGLMAFAILGIRSIQKRTKEADADI